jgi:glutathione S-transferase
MLAPASPRAVHLLGKLPVFTDNRLSGAESGAIIDYLVDAAGSSLSF